ncbi:hypothetical protein ACFLZZ_04660, partial [Nanoarchaeota archaeon]
MNNLIKIFAITLLVLTSVAAVDLNEQFIEIEGIEIEVDGEYSASSLVVGEGIDYSSEIEAIKLGLETLKDKLDELKISGSGEEIDALKDEIDEKEEEFRMFREMDDDPNYGKKVFFAEEDNDYQMASTGELQGLVDAAEWGDTINLEGKTYSECVVVDKSLAFAGIEGTVISGGFDLKNGEYTFSDLKIVIGCSYYENITGIVYDSRVNIFATDVASLTLDNVELDVDGVNGGGGCVASSGAHSYNINASNVENLVIRHSRLDATAGSGGQGSTGDRCDGGYGGHAYNIKGTLGDAQFRNVDFVSRGGAAGNGGAAASGNNGRNDGGKGRNGGYGYNLYFNADSLAVRDSEFDSTGGRGGNGGVCSGYDRA